MDIKDYFEIFYYCASIIIAGVALFSLIQIKVMREVASKQAERDAMKMSLEIYRYYINTILPLLDRVDNSFHVNNIKLDELFELKGTRENPVLIKKPGFAPKFIGNFIVSDCYIVFNDFKNAMAIFASYFNSKVADEETAYNIVGKDYLKSMELYMPLWLMTEGYGDSNELDNKPQRDSQDYHGAIQLYHKWSSKKEVDLSIQEKERIIKYLDNVTVDDTPPFGVNR